LLLVSHDRYFMDHLVDQLFVFEGDGRIRIFNGNYSDYRAEQEEIERQQQEEQAVRKRRAEAESRQQAAAGADKKRADGPDQRKATAKARRKMTFNEKKEYEALEPAIELLETEKSELVTRMGSGDLDYEALQECGRRIGELTAEIDEKTLRWLELDELVR